MRWGGGGSLAVSVSSSWASSTVLAAAALIVCCARVTTSRARCQALLPLPLRAGAPEAAAMALLLVPPMSGGRDIRVEINDNDKNF